MSGQTLTALIHGEAGVGKSTLTDSAPGPRLILDGEGRAKYLPSEPKVFWDPAQQAPPVADGSWQTCVAIVPDFRTMDLVYRWLASGQHGFVSVGVDSLMEAQKRLIDEVAGLDQLDQRDWGVVLRKLEKLVRDYRDLVLVPSNTVQCVIFTCGSKDDNGRMRPLLQGAMATQVPYFVDVVGYMYTTFSPDEPGSVGRALLVQPTPHAVAKDGTHRLHGPSIPDPDLSTIFALLNGGDVAATAAAPTVPSVASE